MGALARPGWPLAVLFACGHNAVRSPMAAGLLKPLLGSRHYVASAGVRKDDLDPFAVAAMEETRHRHRGASADHVRGAGGSGRDSTST